MAKTIPLWRNLYAKFDPLVDHGTGYSPNGIVELKHNKALLGTINEGLDPISASFNGVTYWHYAV